MKQFLADFFAPLIKGFDWFRQWINSAWLWVLGLFAYILAPIEWFLDFVINALNYLTAKLNDLTAKVESMWDKFHESYDKISHILAISNAIFPINHLLVCLGVLISVWLIAMIYRLIKSWIPTVS